MSEREPMMTEAVAVWYDGITRNRTDRQIVGAVVEVAVAARDAEWRAAVERVRIPERTDHINVPTCGACADNAQAVRWNAALDALLREVPHDGQ